MTENNEKFHLDIATQLGGIHENLKGMCREMKEMKEQMIISNSRTRKLEDWKLQVKTQTGLISAIVSGIVALMAWTLIYLK